MMARMVAEGSAPIIVDVRILRNRLKIVLYHIVINRQIRELGNVVIVD